MGFTFHVRPGTTDQRIVDEVYRDNKYRLPNDMRCLDVIDIGANIGAFAIACAERGANVVCYEPHPATYAILCRNIVDSGFSSMIDAHCVGFGPNKYAKLYINPQNYGASSQFLDNNYGLDPTMYDWCRFISPQDVSLFGIEQKIANYIKIDCEGGEIFILEHLIGWEKPDKVFVEFHGRNGEDSIRNDMRERFQEESISDHEFIYTK